MSLHTAPVGIGYEPLAMPVRRSNALRIPGPVLQTQSVFAFSSANTPSSVVNPLPSLATSGFGSVSPGLILKTPPGTLPRMIVPSFSDVMLSGKRSLGWFIEISVILSAANKGAPMAHRVIAKVRRRQGVVTNFIPPIIPYRCCFAKAATSLSFGDGGLVQIADLPL